MKNNKIFLNIASYRDPLMPYTLESLLDRATKPDKVKIGLCWQKGKEEIESLKKIPKKNIKLIKVPAIRSKGACWARSVAFQLMEDEDFSWLLDSHIKPIDNWDELLIDQYYSIGKEKAILSCAASQWDPPDEPREWKEGGGYHAISAASEFWGDILLQMYKINENTNKPYLGCFLTCCNLFTPASWVHEVGYDPDLLFLGEEISLAIRSFTKGYDLYHTTVNMIGHKHDRDYRRVFHDDHDGEFSILQQESEKRLKEQFGISDNKVNLGMYGLGSDRTLEQYQKYVGINFKTKEISESAKMGKPDLDYL